MGVASLSLSLMELVFCYQNCSDLKNCSSDQEKLLKIEAEGRREFAKFLRSQEQFIQTVKGQNNFWYSRVPNRSLSQISIQEGKFSIN